MEDIGKLLILFGILVVGVGLVLVLIGKIPWLGRLPGDIIIQRNDFSCVFPLATSILLSLILTLALNLLLRIIK